MKKQGRWQELLRLMRRNGKIAAAGKLAVGAASITVLSVSGQHIWKQFQADSVFHPELFANSQALHGNQITFPENEEYKGKDQTSDSGENERLQKDRRAEEELGKQKQNQASFEMDAEDPNTFSGDMQNVIVEQNPQDTTTIPSAGLDNRTVLLAGGDNAENADAVYAGGVSNGGSAGAGSTGGSAPGNGAASGGTSGSASDGNGAGGGGTAGGGGGTTGPSQPEQPSDPGNVTPSPDPTPDTPVNPSNPDKVFDPDYPDDSKKPELPSDPTIDGVPVYPYFPENGLSKKYSAELIAYDYSLDDSLETLYEGAVLTDWKLLCSAMFYMQVYEDGEPVGQYRMTEYNDCFRIGTYPKTAKRGLTVTFYFRPNAECEWQEQKVTFENVKYAKYVVVSSADSTSQNEELMEGYLDEGESVYLSEATMRLFRAKPEWNQVASGENFASQIVTEMFPGWSLEPNGEVLHGNMFTPEKGGRYIIYPLDRIPVPEGCEVQLWHGWDQNYDEYCRQVLTRYQADEKKVVIPNGIQEVQCGFPEDIETLYIPETVERFFTIPRVVKAYQVSEYNPFFYEKDGVLYNDTEQDILGIPLEATKLEVSENVESINIPYLNSLQEITFHTPIPPKMDITMLENVTVCIPAGSYIQYFTAWGSQAEGHIVFETAEGEDTDYLVTDAGLLSKDKSILRQASDSCYGLYMVPDTVKKIEAEAFEQAEYIDSVMIPNSVEELPAESLSASGIERIYLYGSVQESAGTIPVIENDTFAIYESTDTEGNTEVVGPEIWVPAGQKAAYVAAWKEILGEEIAETLIHEGFSYQTEKGITWLETTVNGETQAALIHVKPEITSFNEINEILEKKLTWTRIGARAFDLNFEMTLLELPETVIEVDTEAFTHCVTLEIIIFDTKDYFHIGKEAFSNMSSLKFVAFNTKNILFERGSNVRGQFKCYVPDNTMRYYYEDDYIKPYLPNVEAYGDYYTAVPGETGYFAYTLADGKWVTQHTDAEENYSVSMSDAEIMEEEAEEESETDESAAKKVYVAEHTTLLGATSDVSGSISLPSVAKEDGEVISYPLTDILSEALKHCGEDEIIIPDNIAATLSSIGVQAFSHSALSGTLKFTDALTAVGANAFLGCDQLEAVSFGGEVPPALVTYTPGAEYWFGFEKQKKVSDAEDSAEYEFLVDISVPDKEAYKDVWRYYLCGYAPDKMESSIWNDLYWENIWGWAGDIESLGAYLNAMTEYKMTNMLYRSDKRLCEMFELPKPEEPDLQEPNMDDYVAGDSIFDWFQAATPSNAVMTDEILDENGNVEDEISDEDEIQNPYYIPEEREDEHEDSDDRKEYGSTGDGGRHENTNAGSAADSGKNDAAAGAGEQETEGGGPDPDDAETGTGKPDVSDTETGTDEPDASDTETGTSGSDTDTAADGDNETGNNDSDSDSADGASEAEESDSGTDEDESDDTDSENDTDAGSQETEI